jgi:hypothetical protein
MVNIKAQISRLWRSSPPLTAVSGLMLAAFFFSAAGVFLDPRTITGEPAWLKPAKFAISTAIYAASIAWLFRYLALWPRYNRIAGWITALVIVVEVGIIDIQAARGVTSHFNVSTPLDAALFGIMGAAILILWLAAAGLTVEIFRQRFADRAWGWALRTGMLITLLGASLGGLMVKPGPEHSITPARGQSMTVSGGHTVGGPDGGPGLPGIHWSTRHGDLRIPHFLGLHALQMIPLFAWLVRRQRRRERMVIAGAASYFSLTALLLWQALRGEALVAPHESTLAAMAAWSAATFIGLKG